MIIFFSSGSTVLVWTLSQRNYELRFLKAIVQDSSGGQGIEEFVRAF